MPCESGDFTNRIMIIIITRHGNRSTRPKGIETEELPFSRILRRKKDKRGDVFSARRGRSSSLSRLSFEVGSLLVMSCRKPMVVACSGLCCSANGSPVGFWSSRERCGVNSRGLDDVE
jgi:hypothetical protein